MSSDQSKETPVMLRGCRDVLERVSEERGGAALAALAKEAVVAYYGEKTKLIGLTVPGVDVLFALDVAGEAEILGAKLVTIRNLPREGFIVICRMAESSDDDAVHQAIQNLLDNPKEGRSS